MLEHLSRRAGPGTDDQRKRRRDRDAAGLEVRGGEEREPAEQRGLRQHRAGDLEASEPVLRDEQRDGAEHLAVGAQGGGGILGLGGQDGEVVRARRSRRASRAPRRRATMLAPSAVEAEPVLLDRREVLAARGDLDVVTRTIEEGGQGSPDRPRSDDRDAHASSLGADR